MTAIASPAPARPRPGWRLPLLGALVAFAALAVTGVLAHRVPAARTSDAEGLRGFHSLDYGPFTAVAELLAQLAGPAGYGLGGLALVLVALRGGRGRVAAAVAGVLAAAAICTQALKPLIGTPRYGPDGRQLFPEAWPSGHATAAMTLALCGVLVAPAVARGIAALVGAAFAVAVAFAILVLAHHLPSDVVAGFLMAAGWALLATAGLAAAERRWPSRPGRERGAGVGMDWAVRVLTGRRTLVAVLLAALAVLPLVAGTNFATRYTTALVGGAAIAALAAALALGLARTLRPAGPAAGA